MTLASPSSVIVGLIVTSSQLLGYARRAADGLPLSAYSVAAFRLAGNGESLMAFDYEGRGGWYLREVNPLPQAPLHSVLRWILDHLNAGCVRFIGDGDNTPQTPSFSGGGHPRTRRQRMRPQRSRSAFSP